MVADPCHRARSPVLELLNGRKVKILAVRDTFSHVDDAYLAFHQKGFDLADADSFNCGDPERFKFIDFA